MTINTFIHSFIQSPKAADKRREEGWSEQEQGRGDLWQKDNTKSEREDLQDGVW